MRKIILAALLSVTAFTIADARAIKVARIADALTFDPHAQNEGPTIGLQHQVYETLVLRGLKGELMPNLALSWGVTADPLVWEFKLRPGVKFHKGEDFTADDVAFSINRALMPTSDHKGAINSIAEVIAKDAMTVQIKTKAPNPIIPSQLTNIFIMSKKWSEANNVQKPQDFKNKEENYAVRNANGTGAYEMISREQDVKTVLKQFAGYWGKGQFPLGITAIDYVTIKSDATRIAALLSGEVDFVQDLPVQDIARLQGDAKLKVNLGPENRVIFFGMNVGKNDLSSDTVEGKNPFQDKRVKQAMNMAINREALQRVVMRGQSVPAGAVLPPFVNGYTKELDKYPASDLAKAKALMAEAGYGAGFGVTLHCPNDRYVNDEGICQAAVGMLGQIGIKVNLVSQSKALHFPLINKNPPETEFYMLGWGVPTYDSAYILDFLYHTRSGTIGGWNGTGYSNPKLDEMIKLISATVDTTKRNAIIADIWKMISEDNPYIAIHHQTLAYGMKKDLDIGVHPDNYFPWKLFGTK